MTQAQLVARQVYYLTREELRELIRRKRAVVCLILYIVVTLLLLVGLAKLQQHLAEKLYIQEAQQEAGLSKMLEQFDAAMPGLSGLADIPHALWIFQGFAIFWLITLVALVSCDMVTIDIYRGTLRFILLRSQRLAYYLSKFIAHSLLYIVLQALMLVLLLVFCNVSVESFSWGDYLGPAVAYFMVFIPFLLCIVAGTLCISTWTSHPMVALLVVHLAWFIIFLIATKWSIITPFNPKFIFGLVVPLGEHLVYSLLGMTLWTIIFLSLGIAWFVRRDV